MNSYIPTEITVHKKEHELVVVWNDGHTSIYPLSLVRHACPCAECQGGHEQMRAEPAQEVFYLPVEDTPATRLTTLEKVGTYGISIEWEDGHQFGIYDWHYLRALCPCPICREMMIYGQ